MSTKNFSQTLLLISLVAFLLIFNPNFAQGNDRSSRILILIDTSKSMSIEGTRLISPLLEDARRNDLVAKATSIIHYPTSAGPRLVEFTNSAEVDSLVRIFVPSFGGSDLESVFDKAKTWKSNSPSIQIKVIWITDGGGLRRLARNFAIPAELEQIASLENWQVVDISRDNAAKSLEGIVGSFRYIDPNQELSVSKIDLVGITSENSRVELLRYLDWNFSVWALGLSLLFGLIAYLFFVPISNSSLKRRDKTARLDFIKMQSKGNLASERIKIPLLWDKLPKFWKLPVEVFLDSNFEKRSTTRGLPVFVAANIILAFFILIFVQSFIFSLLISALINPYLFKILSRFKERKYDREFDRSLAGILTLASSGLRSGLSLEHSLDAYSKLNNNISAKEIRRVLGEVKMGSSIEEGLKDLAVRRNCPDLNWVVEAISIQRNVGGSLSTIIDTVLQTITERSELRREVRTLSAEGRLSAYVLLGLPIGIFLFLFFSRRDYVEVYWQEPLGFLVLGLIATLISIGWFWMQKVVTIKV